MTTFTKELSYSEKWEQIENVFQKFKEGAEEATITNLRNDLEQYGGTNDITFILGDSKKGIIHIEKRHGKDAINKVIDAVIIGKINKFVQGKKTVHIVHEGYEAVLSLDMYGEKKTWLLTGWDIK
ncbi:MAG: hypothetical protein FWH20_10855 [Oscillospiraceae bacterium]|nr:hypothetical protein [Oscillospiraceae bacterium]